MMRRPIGVTIIPILFLAAAAYFWIGGAILLVVRELSPPALQLRCGVRCCWLGPARVFAAGLVMRWWGGDGSGCTIGARFVAMLRMTPGAARILPGWAAARAGRLSCWDSRLCYAPLASSYLLGPEIMDNLRQTIVTTPNFARRDSRGLPHSSVSPSISALLGLVLFRPRDLPL
jgi:hypothetical protein